MSGNSIQVGGFDVHLVPNKVDRLIARTVRNIARFINKSYFGVKIYGLENIPAPPFLLAPTHRSNIDAMLTASLTQYPMRYMGKDTLWKNRQLGKLFLAFGGFPVNRELADRDAVNICVTFLNHGQALVLFPEGGRREGSVVKDIQGGSAFVALRAKVPIVPVAIAGSAQAMPKGARMPRPKRCVMVIGTPINDAMNYESNGKRIARSQITQLTSKLETDLQSLLDEAKSKLSLGKQFNR